MSFIGIYKAVYSYEPQADQELAIVEDDILYLLEKSDIDDWWTVKKRVVGADVDEPVGLVPSNYIEPANVIGSAAALYDYDKQTDEELSFKELDQFDVYDDKDPDWILVKKQNQEEYGFVPSNYIELRKGTTATTTAPVPAAILPPPSHPSLATSTVTAPVNNDRAEEDYAPALPSVPRPNDRYDEEEQETLPPPKPARPGQESSSSNRGSRQSYDYSDEEYETRAQQKPQRKQRQRQQEEDEDGGELYTWQVSEVDGRKKKKAMLAIGNNTIYFSPDSVHGKSPQQWKIKDLLSFSTEKKHLFFEFRNPLYSLEIHAGSKDVAAQISTIVGELKGSVSNSSLKEVKDATSGKSSSKKKGKILYNFEAQGSDELTVFEGDHVYIINDKKSKDWWMVEHVDTHKTGVVPAQFVSPVKDSSSSSFSSKFKISRSKSKENVKSKESAPSKRSTDVTDDEPARLTGPKPSRVRTWQDRSGTFKVDAEFLGVVEGKIHLHKTNGVKIAVAAPKLSLVDLEYVERVTGMSLESYKSKSSSSRTRAADQDRERSERKERERKRRERDQKERERDQREREEDERERERERARWDKAREKEYRERERERAERERDRSERELEREERERLRQDLDEAKQMAAEAKRAASTDIPSQPSRPSSTQVSGKPKESYDWFEFFLEAGVDVNQCQRYSSNFVKEEIDPNILESIDSSVLRTLGLKEGDIIRVSRYIDAKYNRQPKEISNGGLFSEPSGALKVNRTGSSNQVGTAFPKATSAEPKLDDDAWTVKPAANTESNNLAPPNGKLTQQFTGSMQDLVNLKPLQPNTTSSSVKSNVQTYAPTPSSKVLEPTKAVQPIASSVAPQKTGQITAQPTGLVPLDPFKTGGGNILPLSTGGAFVYLPIQQTGAIALQPTGLIPLQKTGQGALPFQTTGLVPLQKTGGLASTTLPIGGLPTFGTVYQQPLLTGGLPQTTFGQLPLQKTGPMMNPALTGGLTVQQPMMNPALTSGLPLNGQQTFGFNQQPTFNSTLPMGATTFNQPANTFNGGLPQTSFGNGLNSFPTTSFNANPMLSHQPTQFNNLQQTTTGFQPQQQFGFNNQLNQMQNQFQTTSISSPPTFNNAQQQTPFVNQFEQQQQQPFGGNQFGANQFGQQTQPQPTFGGFGKTTTPQPLEAQPTGFGFGNNPSQGQGQQRANLANASADNPFGF